MLFDPLKIREVVLRNRIVVSPMCQYSERKALTIEQIVKAETNPKTPNLILKLNII